MTLNIGIIGLGSIAKKVYLPLLTKETNWHLQGVFTRSEATRREIATQYRVAPYSSLESLAADCDALFVHSSTDSHFAIIDYLLRQGKDVYVDKPLASTLAEAEQLAALSTSLGRKLMVGFNRRFAPFYVEAKQHALAPSIIRLDKHRTNSVGPYNVNFRLLDDYIHVIDTARFLADGALQLAHERIDITPEGYLKQANHTWTTESGLTLSTAMHRVAGTNLERIEWFAEGGLHRVENLQTYEREVGGERIVKLAPSWATILEQRGFVGAVHHFIEAIHGDTAIAIDGHEAVASQRLIEAMLR